MLRGALFLLSVVGIALLASFALSAEIASAQDSRDLSGRAHHPTHPSPAETADRAGSDFASYLSLFGGIHHPGDESVHGYWGGEARAFYRRVGLTLMGQHGFGADYESLLVGSGPIVHVGEWARFRSHVSVGVAWYEERPQGLGISRDMAGAYFALHLAVPVHDLLEFEGQGLTWRGRLDEPRVSSSATRTRYRLTLGFVVDLRKALARGGDR